MLATDNVHNLLERLVPMMIMLVLMPVLGGAVLYKGWRLGGMNELPLARSIKVFFAAIGSAYLIMVVLRLVLPEMAKEGWLGVWIVGLLELLVVAGFLRVFTTRSILVQAASVLAMNVAAYGLVAYLIV
jgi:hypothetical protein